MGVGFAILYSLAYQAWQGVSFRIGRGTRSRSA